MPRASARKSAVRSPRPAPPPPSVDRSHLPGLRPKPLRRSFQVAIIVLVAAGVLFRWTGRFWDDGTMVHPDERFLFMVTAAMETPKTLGEFLDTAHSPMNPHNKNHTFF